jgi:2-dehydro-3-deoxyphosphogalactonate aldolase
MLWRTLERCPLVAILRGIQPDEAVPVGQALVDSGIAAVQVPLGAPNWLESIAALVETIGDVALVGAGVVTSADHVRAVSGVGGRLISSPHTDAVVVRTAVAAGMVTTPGFSTPSEAFTALRNGADGLEIFPAQASSPAALAAIRKVLPEVPILPVGGITPDQFESWWTAGASGFSIGGWLYTPGVPVSQVRERAAMAVAEISRLHRPESPDVLH